MTNARRAKVEILYKGIDISTSLEPYLLDFTYTDNEGKADDIQITLQDKLGRWHNPWLPGKGDKIIAKIITTNWKKEGQTQTLDCGTFYVDEVDFDGPPDTIKIKAISIPLSKGGKNSKRTRVWEKTTLLEIASNIAENSGLTLLYDAPNITYDRIDQIKKTDLAFIKESAKKEGINVKISNEQLVLYDEFSYEKKSSVRKITKGESDILSYSFKIATADNEYKAAQLTYFDQSKKKTIKYVYNVPGVEEGPTLKINERVTSIAEAERRAIKAIRNKNKYEKTGKLTLVGDVNLMQGLSVQVEKFGKYSDKYFIESSVHSVSNGYTTQINIRKALTY